MKICFVTSILYDDNYKEIEKPLDNLKYNSNYDYLLYTNKPELYKSIKIWKVIKFDFYNKINELNKELYKNPKYNIYCSRYIKFQGYKHLLDYDMVIYCDGYLFPKYEIQWEKYDVKKYGLVQQKHFENRYYQEECYKILEHNKDTFNNITKLLNFLNNKNLPKNKTIIENTVFFYDPNNVKIQNLFNFFWDKYITLELSHRDQLLWFYSLEKTNIQPFLFKKHELTNLFVKNHFNHASKYNFHLMKTTTKHIKLNGFSNIRITDYYLFNNNKLNFGIFNVYNLYLLGKTDDNINFDIIRSIFPSNNLKIKYNSIRISNNKIFFTTYHYDNKIIYQNYQINF
jgi:hypothetical protein